MSPYTSLGTGRVNTTRLRRAGGGIRVNNRTCPRPRRLICSGKRTCNFFILKLAMWRKCKHTWKNIKLHTRTRVPIILNFPIFCVAVEILTIILILSKLIINKATLGGKLIKSFFSFFFFRTVLSFGFNNFEVVLTSFNLRAQYYECCNGLIKERTFFIDPAFIKFSRGRKFLIERAWKQPFER